jgi:hypothetical protein
MINFIAGGMMGDFIHSLYAVKNICEQKADKANLYLSDGDGDVWKFGLQRTHDDLNDLIMSQPYINSFNICKMSEFKESFINLNDWRRILRHTDAGYENCWSDVLSECYGFSIPPDYKWLNDKPNETVSGKILIHKSTHRHNPEFPWAKILNNLNDDILFLTSNSDEWDKFQFKSAKIKLHHVSTITEMASAIGSCKAFIGNQSAPAALACALDVQRLVELDADPSKFYMDETKYSNNVSWFLNCSNKFLTKTLIDLTGQL